MIKKSEILFEDEDIIVLIKPDGILSQGDRKHSPDMVNLIKSYLVQKVRKSGEKMKEPPYVAVLHRLDRNVRGIMVYAKSQKAASILSRDLKERKVRKRYLAIVEIDHKKELSISKDWIRLTHFLACDKRTNRSYFVEDSSLGEEAILDYMVLEVKGSRALVSIRLISGRHHQIRVQMTALSYGILGDMKYNNRYNERENNMKPALQCVELCFVHPVLKKKLNFAIHPLGKEFDAFS